VLVLRELCAGSTRFNELRNGIPLMWDMRRNVDPDAVLDRRCVIQFRYPELPESKQKWWLVYSWIRQVTS